MFPGAHIQTDSEINEYLRYTVHTCNALVDTCKMGSARDPHAVVDGEIKVHGVHSLRVVDASVMPNIIGGHTSVSTVMIAERASDLLMASQ